MRLAQGWCAVDEQRCTKMKSRCSQPKLLAAQSLTYKPPKWFLRWQPGLAKHKLPICIPTRHRRSMFPGRHAICFHLPHVPCETCDSFSRISCFLAEHGAFRLFFGWLSSTAGYVPGNEAQLSSSDIASLRRVLPKGCYLFLSRRSEKPFDLSWQAFRLQRWASYSCKQLCCCSLPEPHASVRRSPRWSQRP